jgi:hypothetical protein
LCRRIQIIVQTTKITTKGRDVSGSHSWYAHFHRTVTEDIREKVANEVNEYYACRLESWQLQHEVWKRIKERDFGDRVLKAEAAMEGQK